MQDGVLRFVLFALLTEQLNALLIVFDRSVWQHHYGFFESVLQRIEGTGDPFQIVFHSIFLLFIVKLVFTLRKLCSSMLCEHSRRQRNVCSVKTEAESRGNSILGRSTLSTSVSKLFIRSVASIKEGRFLFAGDLQIQSILSESHEWQRNIVNSRKVGIVRKLYCFERNMRCCIFLFLDRDVACNAIIVVVLKCLHY